MNTLTKQATQATSMPVGNHLYDESLQFTHIDEYGISLQALATGQVSPPSQGARFDIAFEGVVRGDKVNGTVKGVDYLLVRADGRFMLDIHARIVTDDGETIAVYADGISSEPEPDTGIAQIRKNVRLTTNSAKYAWLNQLQVWETGETNLNTGKLRLSSFAA